MWLEAGAVQAVHQQKQLLLGSGRSAVDCINDKSDFDWLMFGHRAKVLW
jgi:hypothetical protein